MDTFTFFTQTLLDLVRIWSSVFAFDFGRYLLGALVATIVLILLPQAVIERRRVRFRQPSSAQWKHEVWHSFTSAIVFSLIGLGIYFGTDVGVFRIYGRVAEFGWPYWIAILALIIVAHDAYFYWTHRWLHRPRLFARVHRTHHVSVAPTQWAAYSFSPGEALTQAMFLPVFLLLVPTHATIPFIWVAHQVLRNVFGHCGVELEPRSWLATWWGRWFTTTLHHDMHHALGRCNFGLYFTWWDRWCGTEHPDYRAKLRQLVDAGTVAMPSHLRSGDAT